MWFTIWLLYLVEFANWDFCGKIGYGGGDGSNFDNMGYTDSMPYHTGTTQSSRSTCELGTQYRNIEGLWENCREWLDGCYCDDDSKNINIILNPSNFSDSSGGVPIGVPKSGTPSKFGVRNVRGTFPVFIPVASNGSEGAYSCDDWQVYTISGNPRPCMCTSLPGIQEAGLFWVDNAATFITYNSRIMELP
jgi:hypothetical protein